MPVGSSASSGPDPGRSRRSPQLRPQAPGFGLLGLGRRFGCGWGQVREFPARMRGGRGSAWRSFKTGPFGDASCQINPRRQSPPTQARHLCPDPRLRQPGHPVGDGPPRRSHRHQRGEPAWSFLGEVPSRDLRAGTQARAASAASVAVGEGVQGRAERNAPAGRERGGGASEDLLGGLPVGDAGHRGAQLT
jgi:hypothetical protein